jgi:hypothetical protein
MNVAHVYTDPEALFPHSQKTGPDAGSPADADAPGRRRPQAPLNVDYIPSDHQLKEHLGLGLHVDLWA